GTSTNGLPYIAVTISAPTNLEPQAREQNRQRLETLWDARNSAPDKRQDAIDNARPVGFILATQHSTEIGAALMSMQYAFDMASATDAESLSMLEETIAVLIPSHNPDGINIIHDWYERIVDT